MVKVKNTMTFIKMMPFKRIFFAGKKSSLFKDKFPEICICTAKRFYPRLCHLWTTEGSSPLFYVEALIYHISPLQSLFSFGTIQLHLLPKAPNHITIIVIL